VVRVDSAIHTAIEVGDEPLLLARYAPCFVAKRRTLAAHAAIKAGASVIIMDDGLQNPSLVKDFTLLVVDGTYGFGNRFMLPAGPCREPVSKSLAKADAVLIMGEDKNPTIRRILPKEMPVFSGTLAPAEGIALSGRKVHPFAGIAFPDKFFETVASLGGSITLASRFPDHHAYTQRDLDRLLRESSAHESQLVTTEKDFVRLPEAFRSHVLPIPVKLEVTNHSELLALLERGIAA
jgi:tetraacyldisaccharide 4'-kinase